MIWNGWALNTLWFFLIIFYGFQILYSYHIFMIFLFLFFPPPFFLYGHLLLYRRDTQPQATSTSTRSVKKTQKKTRTYIYTQNPASQLRPCFLLLLFWRPMTSTGTSGIGNWEFDWWLMIDYVAVGYEMYALMHIPLMPPLMGGLSRSLTNM